MALNGVPYYAEGKDEEKVTDIKAVSYNLENGKIVKSKLDKDNIIKEKTSENWYKIKFALPNVKEGTIIEVKYSIISDYIFNLREWAFQSTIPILESAYKVWIPEYFFYNQTQKGYFPITTEKDSKFTKLTLTYIQEDMSMSRKGHASSSNTFEYREDMFFYRAKDVKAFPDDEYVKTIDNFLTKIEFELNHTKYPNQPIENYTSTWESVNEKLMDNEYFGKALKSGGHLDDATAQLKQSGLTGISLVNAAFGMVKSKMAWNSINSKYVENSLRKAWKDGAGNCADINLNLVALLRQLGFSSNPVILSTRNNGIIHPAHPSMSRFNYVIALVNLDGKQYLLDATDPNAEINLLPVRCLNDKGRIVNEVKGDWINLMDYKPYILNSRYELTLDDALNLKGKALLQFKDYGAYSYRKDIKKVGEADYLKEMENEYKNTTLENLTINGLDSVNKLLSINFDLTKKTNINKTDSLIFFSPAFFAYVENNPFKAETREYPVEMKYPYTIYQTNVITLPENYKVVELPKSYMAKLPDNKGKYTYMVNVNGNVINTSIIFQLNASLFLPEEYKNLRSFYQTIVDKQNEMITVKVN